MGRLTKVSKHLTEEEIKMIYKSGTNCKDKLKLLALINLYNGKNMKDTAEYLMLSYSNLKKFVKEWNDEGIKSLSSVSSINKREKSLEEVKRNF